MNEFEQQTKKRFLNKKNNLFGTYVLHAPDSSQTNKILKFTISWYLLIIFSISRSSPYYSAYNASSKIFALCLNK